MDNSIDIAIRELRELGGDLELAIDTVNEMCRGWNASACRHEARGQRRDAAFARSRLALWAGAFWYLHDLRVAA